MKKITLYFISSSLILGAFYNHARVDDKNFVQPNSLIKKILYADVVLDDPLIIDLVESQAFKRLAQVRQYGIDPLVLPMAPQAIDYNRYNHCLGVYWLCRIYGAPFNEQVAALLHDASHTTFSHVGDYLFEHKDGKNSYQDDHHLEFLNETDIPAILNKYGLKLSDIDHKNSAFLCLENSLPEICADRLEYNLTGGIIEGLITRAEACEILKNLKFEGDRWYFICVDQAKKFAYIPLWHTLYRWGCPSSAYVSEIFVLALRRALELSLITLQEIKHGADDDVWYRLVNSSDSQIVAWMKQIFDAHTHADDLNKGQRTNKFRGVDPWVQVEEKFFRLTALDQEFKDAYDCVQHILGAG